LNLSGRVRSLFHSPEGAAAFALKAANLDPVAKLIAKLRPEIADVVQTRIGGLSPVDISAKVNASTDAKAAGNRATATVVVEGTAGPQHVHFEARASGNPSDLAAMDVKASGDLAAAESAELVRLLGLGGWVNVDKGSGTARV